jgi:tetratricopeptide (TPR) repeat protein
LGLAWRRDLPGFLALHLGAGLERATGLAPRLQIGTEVELRGTMTIRTGLDDGRLAAGTSIHWSGLSIDYAYEQKDLGSTQRVGISKSIGPSVSQRREAARIAEEVNLTERLDQAYERRMADQLNTWLARASEAQAAGRIDEALEAVAAARAIAPTDARAQELEADLLRANAAKLEAAGDPAGAALAYGRALEAWPGDSLAVAGRRRAEAELSRRASRSKHAGEVDRAYALFVSGDLIGAQAALRKLHDVMPGDSATTALLDRVETTLDERRSQCMARARRDLEAGRLDEAARGLDEARRLGVPDSEIAALQDALDRERRKADDHREAPRPVARVTAPAGPTEAQRREADQDYRRGVDLAAAGRTDQALRFWEIAFTLDPDHRGVRRALEREYLLRGMVAFGRGRFAEAETHWARAVELDPSDARARGYLERARTQLERTRELTRTGR